MATGDISSATIRATGWDADIVLLGFNTSTTYNFTDPITGTNKLRFTVTSTGYGSNKSGTTPARTVYGTAIVRKAYPNNASLDETTSGSDVIIRVALSSRIRTGDTVVLDADAGAFSNGGSSNAVSSLACTNSSGLSHPKAFAQWAQRPFDRWQANPTLAVTARHMYGISAVDIILTDTHGHTVTTACSLLARMRAATGLYAEEWVATCDLSTLTQGDVITARYKVYPTIGDAITDSNDNSITDDNNALGVCNYTYFNDKNATADVYAVVDGVNGHDSGGSVGVSSSTLATAAATPYLTVAKAISVGTANVIYLRSGSVYNILGGTVTAPSSFGYWRQIKVYPGDGATIVEITGTATYNTPHLSYEGLTYRLNTGANWFDGSSGARYLSFKDCTFDANGKSDNGTVSHFGYRSACVFFSGCVWADASKFGFFDDFAARVCHWFDGCDLTSLVAGNTTATYRMVACKAKKIAFLSKDNGASTGPANDPWFIEFNTLMDGSKANALLGAFNGSASNSNGISLTGNIVERTSGTNPGLQIGADSNTCTFGHVCMWHNTIPGERANVFYNDTGTTAYLKGNVSMCFNAFGGSPTAGAVNIKSDLFGTPSGNRIGNWSELYGVDCVGNAQRNSSGFCQAFPGLGMANTMDFGGEGHTNAAVCTIAFTNDKSVYGSGTGNGDYTPLSTSALRGLVVSQFQTCFFDLNGRVIGGGAYAGALQPVPISGGLLTMGVGS